MIRILLIVLLSLSVTESYSGDVQGGSESHGGDFVLIQALSIKAAFEKRAEFALSKATKHLDESTRESLPLILDQSRRTSLNEVESVFCESPDGIVVLEKDRDCGENKDKVAIAETDKNRISFSSTLYEKYSPKLSDLEVLFIHELTEFVFRGWTEERRDLFSLKIQKALRSHSSFIQPDRSFRIVSHRNTTYSDRCYLEFKFDLKDYKSPRECFYSDEVMKFRAKARSVSSQWDPIQDCLTQSTGSFKKCFESIRTAKYNRSARSNRITLSWIKKFNEDPVSALRLRALKGETTLESEMKRAGIEMDPYLLIGYIGESTSYPELNVSREFGVLARSRPSKKKVAEYIKFFRAFVREHHPVEVFESIGAY